MAMSYGAKAALALAAVVGLLVVTSKPAAATPAPSPAPPVPPPPPLPQPGTILPVTPPAPATGFPAPKVPLPAGTAAVYAIISRVDGSVAPWGPFEVADISSTLATNAGYIVNQVNNSPVVTPAPLPTEAVQVFVVDASGAILNAFAFQGGTTVTPANNLQYGLVGFDPGVTPPSTFAAAAAMNGGHVLVSYSNGSSDRSVQKAAALYQLGIGQQNYTHVAVYDLSSGSNGGNIDVDPATQLPLVFP